jgi:hypothetical protein
MQRVRDYFQGSGVRDQRAGVRDQGSGVRKTLVEVRGGPGAQQRGTWGTQL